MKGRKIAELIFFVTLLPTLLSANDRGIGLKKAKELAVENSNQLIQKHFEAQKAEAQYKNTRSNILPKLDLSSNYARTYDVTKIKGTPIAKKYSTEHTLTLSQVLFTFGKISNAINASRIGMEAANINKDKFQNSIKAMASKSYYAALLAQKTLKIYEESVENAKANKTILLKRGRAPQSDLLKVARDISSRTPTLHSAKDQLDQAMNNLIEVLGVEGEVTLTDRFKKDLDIPGFSYLKDKMESNDYNLKLAAKDLQIKKSLYKSSKADRLPVVSAFSTYSYTGEDNQSDFSTRNSLVHAGAVGVQITFPIWDSGKRSSEVSKTFAEKKISEYRMKDLKRKTNLKLRNLYSKFSSLQKELEENRKFVKLAEKTFVMSQKRFRSGQTTVTELNDTEHLLTQAKLQLALNLFNLHLTKIDIEELVVAEV